MSLNQSPTSPGAAEANLDCRSCGLCCRGRPGTVLVEPADLLRWKRAGREDLERSLTLGHFSLPALPSDSEGRCLHQQTSTSLTDCTIYVLRPSACRDFQAGSPACLAARSAGGRD